MLLFSYSFILFQCNGGVKNLVLRLISAIWSQVSLSGFHLCLRYILVSFLTCKSCQVFVHKLGSFILVCSVLPCTGPDESWYEIFRPLKQFLPLFPSSLSVYRPQRTCLNFDNRAASALWWTGRRPHAPRLRKALQNPSHRKPRSPCWSQLYFGPCCKFWRIVQWKNLESFKMCQQWSVAGGEAKRVFQWAGGVTRV